MHRMTVAGFIGLLAVSASSAFADPAITIYNQNFGVVRDTISLDLKKGVNQVSATDISAHVEPDLVILRDPTGMRNLTILEQNYRNDPISQGLLLNYFEGQTIDFQVGSTVVKGKIIRSGYVPHTDAYAQYGYQYQYAQQAMVQEGSGDPIVEVGGKLQFGLPGQPIFPALAEDAVLKPTLTWELSTDKAGPLTAELAYITDGMTWHADYNIVAPEKGNTVDLVGWITMDNETGKTFENAHIKLMAGTVSKVQDQGRVQVMGMIDTFASGGQPPVTEKAFDEYHLYTLDRTTTLRDRETKQVEFVQAAGVTAKPLYVYDGAFIDPSQYNGWSEENYRTQPDYGTQSNPKVWVMREFANSAANHLGMPLPAGRMRFYRRDTDGQLEFVGEHDIDHTPKDEVIRVYTGDAFDVVGERVRDNFTTADNTADESFSITLRNHKDEAVDVHVTEHMYRWSNWEITAKSQDYIKKDSRTIEFPVTVPANGSRVVTYKVHYSW